MLDLMSENKRRGIAVLSSKNYRTLENNLFNYKVDVDCVETYVKYIRMYLERKGYLDDYISNELNFINNWLYDANKCVDKARDVLR